MFTVSFCLLRVMMWTDIVLVLMSWCQIKKKWMERRRWRCRSHSGSCQDIVVTETRRTCSVFLPPACKHFISALQQHSCPKNNAMWARALRWHCRQQTVFCSGFMNHHYRCHMISNSSYSAQTCSHAFAPTCKQRGWHHVIAQPTFILILYPNSEIGSWYGWWGQ